MTSKRLFATSLPNFVAFSQSLEVLPDPCRNLLHNNNKKNFFTTKTTSIKMDDRDWNTVTLNKKAQKPRTQGQKDAQLREAQRKGNTGVSSMNKGTSNKQRRGPDNYSKIDQAEDAQKIKTVDKDISRAIQQARNAKGMTQKELATKINEPQKTIQDYECGRAIPSNQVLGKIERVLGVKLRGKR